MPVKSARMRAAVSDRFSRREMYYRIGTAQDRPLALEEKADPVNRKLLDLCYDDTPGYKHMDGEDVARDLLFSGKALAKMKK